ncbi:chromate resistance protein, partial [Escherichia coli]|nr:chromate resistance protein [Escherichia coli]
DRRSHQHPDVSGPGAPELTPAELKRRVWVTRRHVHVDRIASAWLIRRFIDPEASFKFVEGKGYVPEPDELRFDMADAEFTHEGDR